jgi:hypothetical protein
MKTKIFIAVFALFAALVSCKKAEKGEMGSPGANGTNGTNGNANVKMYSYGKDSIQPSDATIGISLSMYPEITTNLLDSSAVLVYHQVGGNWYSSPGLGYAGDYQIRIYSYNPSKNIYLVAQNPDGASYTGIKYIVSQTKIVIIPSSDYKGSRKKHVDFSNYEETMKYYGLPLD